MDKGFSSDTVDLADAFKVLAQSNSVQTLLKEQVGSDSYAEALRLMKAGNLDSALGETLHDFFIDAIRNDATTVWTGFIHDENDDWPINVNEYHGVFWISALEYDPIGYFLNSDSAIAYARTAWDNVYEDGQVPEGEAESSEDVCCPFCNTTEDCDHLLLVVDQTFRQAEGGILYEAFNARWIKILEEANDPNFDEREPFEELLEEVDSFADAEREASPESAPGMSSTYSFYYCSSKERLQAAFKKFTSR